MRVQVSPLLPLLFTLFIPMLSRNETVDTKKEGCTFGGITIRQIKRKRQRQLEKKQAKARVSPHSDQAARGFA